MPCMPAGPVQYSKNTSIHKTQNGTPPTIEERDEQKIKYLLKYIEEHQKNIIKNDRERHR